MTCHQWGQFRLVSAVWRSVLTFAPIGQTVSAWSTVWWLQSARTSPQQTQLLWSPANYRRLPLFNTDLLTRATLVIRSFISNCAFKNTVKA